MLYFVCMYIAICGLALIFLPCDIPESRAKKGTIFDRDEPKKEMNEFDKTIEELLKDIPDLNLGD